MGLGSTLTVHHTLVSCDPVIACILKIVGCSCCEHLLVISRSGKGHAKAYKALSAAESIHIDITVLSMVVSYWTDPQGQSQF
jgi:hypothetical protein